MPVNLRAKNVKLNRWEDGAAVPQLAIRQKLQWLQAENQRLGFLLQQANRTGDREDQKDYQEALAEIKDQFDRLTSVEKWLSTTNASRDVDRARREYNEYVSKYPM